MKLAGAEGIEPPLAVLETAGLPLTDAPANWTDDFERPAWLSGPAGPAHRSQIILPLAVVYFTSRWTVCFRSLGQYFFSSSRPGLVFLFFVVV